jgi:hypothetical protein
MTCSKMSNSLLLHLILLSLTTRVRWYMCVHVCPLAHGCEWKEDPVEKICWQHFFVKGSERERRHINFHTNTTVATSADDVILIVATFDRCQAGLITIATGADAVNPLVATKDHLNRTQNFCPTLPTILHVNHIINWQQYDLVGGDKKLLSLPFS